MRLQAGGWTPVPDTDESHWVAAAEAQEDGPVIMLSVVKMYDGQWSALADLRDQPGTWSQPGFFTRSGAMAWCETKVDELQGGGRS